MSPDNRPSWPALPGSELSSPRPPSGRMGSQDRWPSSQLIDPETAGRNTAEALADSRTRLRDIIKQGLQDPLLIAALQADPNSPNPQLTEAALKAGQTAGGIIGGALRILHTIGRNLIVIQPLNSSMLVWTRRPLGRGEFHTYPPTDSRNKAIRFVLGHRLIDALIFGQMKTAIFPRTPISFTKPGQLVRAGKEPEVNGGEAQIAFSGSIVLENIDQAVNFVKPTDIDQFTVRRWSKLVINILNRRLADGFEAVLESLSPPEKAQLNNGKYPHSRLNIANRISYWDMRNKPRTHFRDLTIIHDIAGFIASGLGIEYSLPPGFDQPRLKAADLAHLLLTYPHLSLAHFVAALELISGGRFDLNIEYNRDPTSLQISHQQQELRFALTQAAAQQEIQRKLATAAAHAGATKLEIMQQAYQQHTGKDQLPPDLVAATLASSAGQEGLSTHFVPGAADALGQIAQAVSHMAEALANSNQPASPPVTAPDVDAAFTTIFGQLAEGTLNARTVDQLAKQYGIDKRKALQLYAEWRSGQKKR